MSGVTQIENAELEGVEEAITPYMRTLMKDLADMLLKESGFPFEVRMEGHDLIVEPYARFAQQAALREHGSFALETPPQPFFKKTIAAWREKHGL